MAEKRRLDLRVDPPYITRTEQHGVKGMDEPEWKKILGFHKHGVFISHQGCKKAITHDINNNPDETPREYRSCQRDEDFWNVFVKYQEES